MNKDKVYLKGYVIGRAADTLGYKGLLVQLENLDVVEIDENLVHKDINEPQKPVIPQFVADWYEKNKNNLDYNIWNYVYEWKDQEEDEFKNWFNHSNKAFQIIANMHQFGYEVENEKRYLVKIKGIDSNARYLKRVRSNWIISESDEHKHAHIHTSHTRKQLEEAGFGEVFNSTLFEVEEVEG